MLVYKVPAFKEKVMNHTAPAAATMLRLPPRRLEQLKAIARAIGQSGSDTVASMIREKIAAGVIPDAIPGIVIDKVPGGVLIQIDDVPRHVMNLDDAEALVTAIRATIARKISGEMNVDHDFMVMNRGGALKIAVPMTAKGSPFTPDLANDLADLIEKALV
jgi:hypothetical protein